tara:strand:- start:1337 stop:1711 length:375 start_codon:yes stop_codon:yes gene_type:complete
MNMIHEGKDGSVSAFYKNRLIISRPLGGRRTLEDYRKEANRIVIEGLRLGHSVKDITKQNREFIKKIRYKELKIDPTKDDRDLIFLCVLMLIKFKVIDEDGDQEGLLVMGRKKPNKVADVRHQI